MTSKLGESPLRIRDGWLLCAACDEPVRALLDGSYGCGCQTWKASVFRIEVERLREEQGLVEETGLLASQALELVEKEDSTD